MAVTTHPSPGPASDGRHVVLLKSLSTNNRFYALVATDSGLKNADTIDEFPPGLLLGVAYPCLEDGLNDFAVIRTTFETIDYFPDDESMRDELMSIIDEARDKLIRRLTELRDRIADSTAHFLGTDLAEYRGYAMNMVHRGYPRRNLDSMMKLNVFMTVAAQEEASNGPEPLFYYAFRDKTLTGTSSDLTARQFVAAMFSDVLDAVQDPASYGSRHIFDRDVFQKFIAMMFINYATTDPIFYGTHKADYGVSADRDMDNTPLHRAIDAQLREIEARMLADVPTVVAPEIDTEWAEPDINLPQEWANEEVVVGPLASICAAARRLVRLDTPDAVELGRVVLANVAILIDQLKEHGIIGESAYDPTSNNNGPARP